MSLVVKPWLALSGPAFSPRSAAAEKLSTVEVLRRDAGISHARLAQAAAVDLRWLFRVLREPHRASGPLVAKLQAGLRRLQAERTMPAAPLILATYGGFLLAIAPFYGVTPSEVRASDPRRGATADRHWQRCAHARQAALSLTNTALGVPQRQLAAALGLTPAAVCLALRDVEERRSDPRFEAALQAAQRDVTGGCDE